MSSFVCGNFVSANVSMSEVTSYLRRFRQSVGTGSTGCEGVDFSPILHRLDSFLASHLGECI